MIIGQLLCFACIPCAYYGMGRLRAKNSPRMHLRATFGNKGISTYLEVLRGGPLHCKQHP